MDALPGATIRSGVDRAVLADAVIRLRTSRLVAMPTETVYGLAASTVDPEAVRRIYSAKERPADNPLIAHLSSVEMATPLCRSWPDAAAVLARACWPGPLAMVLDRDDSVPAIAAGGRDSIAVRMPAHPVALDLIESFGGPVSAPSANRSGSISPTEARHVLGDFADEDLRILDGGPCRIGLESTVVELRSACTCLPWPAPSCCLCSAPSLYSLPSMVTVLNVFALNLEARLVRNEVKNGMVSPYAYLAARAVLEVPLVVVLISAES